MTALGGIFCRQRKAVALGFYRKLLQHNALTAESRAKKTAPYKIKVSPSESHAGLCVIEEIIRSR
jgi:hypothetical protein